MKITNSKTAILLVLGDLIAYLFSLILTLIIRYGEIPSKALIISHLPAFSILFILFLIINFSSGLYDKQSSFVRNRIQGLIIKAQIVNIFAGITFFYLAPVAIAPKANLAIYFIISTLVLWVWRVVMFPVFNFTRNQPAILVGAGDDIQDIYEEINKRTNYGILFKEKISPQLSVDATVSAIAEAVERNQASVIVADLHNPTIEAAMPFLYSLIFSGLQVIDAEKLYEAIFDRISLSMVGERWLVVNAGSALGGRRVYDSLKRAMDVIIASVVGVISLVLYPLVYIAVKLDDGGSLFIFQERVGKNGKPIRIAKFRSMTADDGGAYANNGGKTELSVTRAGKFIRLTRIDELPQLWSVIKGEQSLIGPRPELPALVAVYQKEIPYYNIRHLIKPGLSGWAQIYHRAHPHHAVAVDDTRDKLSYDLYYMKNRSLTLDIRIALQTIRSLLSRQGV
jgi:lipopolysaccharide/colanic/teichoic acid biosynthesis glycosyltransferase